MNPLPPADRLLSAADQALRTLFSSHMAVRATPRPSGDPAADAAPARADDRRLSAALMRVNHVGEVCAQALYQAQALSTRDPQLKAHFEAAARDETDHLCGANR